MSKQLFIKKRQNLCRDLSDAILFYDPKHTLLEIIIDEYIYKCNEDECDELKRIIRNEYGVEDE